MLWWVGTNIIARVIQIEQNIQVCGRCNLRVIFVVALAATAAKLLDVKVGKTGEFSVHIGLI